MRVFDYSLLKEKTWKTIGRRRCSSKNGIWKSHILCSWRFKVANDSVSPFV